MNHTVYFDRLNKFLSSKYDVFRDDKIKFLSVCDNNNDSPIFINLENFSVGIGNTCEFYDLESPELNLNKSLWRFLTLLNCRIKRIEYRKGKLLFKVNYETISEIEKPYKATSMTWLFPFWKKSKVIEMLQGPLFSINEIENEFNDIKKAAHNTGVAPGGRSRFESIK